MTKVIYLLRHAEAMGKFQHQLDKERELTTNGIQECQLVARQLHNDFRCDAIFTSTATRTLETTYLFADIIKYPKDKIIEVDDLYEASPRTFNEFILNLDDNLKSVMIVGHNPTISYIMEYLTRSDVGDMQTAGVASIHFSFDQWKEIAQGTGELRSYIYPSMFKS